MGRACLCFIIYDRMLHTIPLRRKDQMMTRLIQIVNGLCLMMICGILVGGILLEGTAEGREHDEIDCACGFDLPDINDKCNRSKCWCHITVRSTRIIIRGATRPSQTNSHVPDTEIISMDLRGFLFDRAGFGRCRRVQIRPGAGAFITGYDFLEEKEAEACLDVLLATDVCMNR